MLRVLMASLMRQLWFFLSFVFIKSLQGTIHRSWISVPTCAKKVSKFSLFLRLILKMSTSFLFLNFIFITLNMMYRYSSLLIFWWLFFYTFFRAFSSEIAAVCDNVSTKTIGLMRMQFWRDTIGKSPAMVVFPPFFFPLGLRIWILTANGEKRRYPGTEFHTWNVQDPDQDTGDGRLWSLTFISIFRKDN